MGTSKTFGPAFLANAVANIYAPAASTIIYTIRLIRITNVTASAATYTLYRGATGGSAAGTELAKTESVPANSSVTIPLQLEMSSTDFLTGLASAANTLTITVMGEQRVV